MRVHEPYEITHIFTWHISILFCEGKQTFLAAMKIDLSDPLLQGP